MTLSNSAHLDSQVLPESIIQGDYRIFPNVVLYPLEATDCNDAVDCLCREFDLQECMNFCSDSEVCSNGYHVETNGKHLCVPIYNGRYGFENVRINPILRARQKEIYGFLNNSGVTYFQKKELPFPPDDSATIYTKDILSIKTWTGSWWEIDGWKNKAMVNITKNFENKTNFEVIPTVVITNKLAEYQPLKLGQWITFRLPASNLMSLNVGDIEMPETRKLSFELATTNTTVMANSELRDNMKYQILDPDNMDDLEGPIISRKYYIIKNKEGEFIYVNDKAQLGLTRDENILKNKTKSRFSFWSQMNVYYCDNGECKSTNVTNTKVEGTKLFAVNTNGQNSEAFYNEMCYGFCQDKKETQPSEAGAAEPQRGLETTLVSVAPSGFTPKFGNFALSLCVSLVFGILVVIIVVDFFMGARIA